MKLIYKTESYSVLGACFTVYKTMGAGFLESVYQECLEIELDKQNIPFIPQKSLELFYDEIKLQQKYKPDFICHDKIIIEIKAIKAIDDNHRAQLLNYLKASKMKLGFLINFGHQPKLEYERYVNL